MKVLVEHYDEIVGICECVKRKHFDAHRLEVGKAFIFSSSPISYWPFLYIKSVRAQSGVLVNFAGYPNVYALSVGGSLLYGHSSFDTLISQAVATPSLGKEQQRKSVACGELPMRSISLTRR